MSNENFVEKILSERVIASGNRLSILEREIEIAPGKTVHWEVLSKADSVAMVAVDNQMRVYLVDQYFGAINQRSLCLPMGKIDYGETPDAAALRELQEEIGMTGQLQLLGTMDVSPGYISQKTYLYLVTSLSPSKLKGDEEHYFQVVQVPLSEAIDYCLAGKIQESRTIAGLALAKMRLKTQA